LAVRGFARVNAARRDAAEGIVLSFAEDWRVLVDLDRLQSWMDDQRVSSGRIDHAETIAGGTQNLLLRFRRGEQWFVLRRPAADPRPGAEAAMGREARVLAALAGTNVPHPRLVASCSSPDVIGAPFYIMESVVGFNAALGMPKRFAEDAAARRHMGFALIDGAAALAQVDVEALGIGDLGKPDGFLERQVGRWRQHLENYAQYEGWPGAAQLPGVHALAMWLEANRPPSFIKGLMHGDYHIANVLFHFERPELAAIVDWELATIGDPLIDLGWVLATWPDADGVAAGAPTPIQPWDAFPARDELIEHYGQATGRDLTHVRWYHAFACFKLGVMLEGAFARSVCGRADAAIGKDFHARTIALFEQAQRLIQS
jgi:aminoglycoside phosphotransferase (APT) family kinase protein